MNGKQLDTLIRNTFQLSKDAPITVAQANHVIQMLKPTNYLLAHHKIRGKPVTYTVPNYDTTKALMHRPQQIDILNDLSHEVTIMKGRQLGLIISSPMK